MESSAIAYQNSHVTALIQARTEQLKTGAKGSRYWTRTFTSMLWSTSSVAIFPGCPSSCAGVNTGLWRRVTRRPRRPHTRGSYLQPLSTAAISGSGHWIEQRLDASR